MFLFFKFLRQSFTPELYARALQQSQRAAMLAPRIRSVRKEVVVGVVQNPPRLKIGEADLLGEEERIHLLDELARIAAGQMPLGNQPNVLVVRSAPLRIASKDPGKGAGPECRPVDVIMLGRADGPHINGYRRRRRCRSRSNLARRALD